MVKKLGVYVLALTLLGGIAAERISLLPSKSATSFHERVKALGLKIPLSFGTWVGKDLPVDHASISMLKPNVLVSRDYHNISTGQHVGFLFDQCSDARAIADHYPPICYVNQGYKQLSVSPRNWNVQSVNITANEYLFSRNTLTSSSSVFVANFIVMPDGQIVRDMSAAKAAASDVRRRFFGAAQFEFVLDAGLSTAERDDICNQFLTANLSLIHTLLGGDAP